MSKEIIKTEKAPAAIGPYSQAVKAGNFLYISGQIPIDPATGNIVSGGIQAQTNQSMKNLQAICEVAGVTLNDAVKTTIFITDLKEFGKVNETYGKFFAENAPARACVEVSALPKNSLVEIEAVVYIG